MTKKRSLTLALVLLAAGLLAFVGAGATTAATGSKSSTFKVCLVTDIGGLNDKSFNHLAFVGLTRAKTQLKAQILVEQSKSAADYIPNLSTCARKGYSLTIGVGFLMADAMDTVASKFPKSKFAIVDVDVLSMKHKPKNVQGLLFKEQEAGYAVGYLAGLWVKAHPSGGEQTVGSVGGIKIPPVDRYIAGYIAGAKKANPAVKTLNAYSQDFVDQAKCKEAALNQIANGASVIFQVAGQCGLGALDAAKEKGVFGIGVDADQGYLGSHILTSALKRVDVAVFAAEKAAQSGGLKTGINAVFSAKNGGVGIGKTSPKVPASMVKATKAILAQLAAGKIVPPQTVP